MEEHLQEDLATLSELDEKSLLESLSQRFKKDKIYVSKMFNVSVAFLNVASEIPFNDVEQS